MKTKKENNMQNNKRKQKNGFSIVEVMVASGLMAIMSVGIITMLGNANKSQRSLQAKDLQREIIAEVVSHLSNKQACLGTFTNSVTRPARRGAFGRMIPASTITTGLDPTAGPLNVGTIKNDTGADKYAAATNHPSGLLRYQKFTLQDWAPDSVGSLQGTAKLAVTLAKLGDVSGPKDLAPINIGLRIKLNASNQIVDCFSMGSNANGFWLADGANIYYGGDIDVRGGVKIAGVGADTDTACTVVGQQRFNSRDQIMQFCNGTSWAPLGVPSGGLKLYRNPYDADRLIALTDADAAVVAAPYYPQCTQCGSACSPTYCAAGYSNAGESCIMDGRCNARTSRVRRCTRTCIGTGYGAPLGSIIPVN